MILLLHGENISASRNRLKEIRDEFLGEVLELDGKNLAPEQLAQALAPGTLFDTEKLVIIDSVLDLRVDKRMDSLDLQNVNVALWQDKKLTRTQSESLEKLFPNLKVEEFKVDQVVFRFLETIKPGGQKAFIPLWQKYVESEPVEIAATMLIRQFRFLLLAKLAENTGPDDFKNLAPWQVARLKKQADLFSPDGLKEIIKRLLEIDYQNKSGLLPISIQTSLELLLLSL